MILDCVDWDDENTEAAAVGNLYDLLYQMYCAKLTPEGLPYAHETQLRNYLNKARTGSIESKGGSMSTHEREIMIYIFVAIATLLSFVYLLVLFFTVCDYAY